MGENLEEESFEAVPCSASELFPSPDPASRTMSGPSGGAGHFGHVEDTSAPDLPDVRSSASSRQSSSYSRRLAAKSWVHCTRKPPTTACVLCAAASNPLVCAGSSRLIETRSAAPAEQARRTTVLRAPSFTTRAVRCTSRLSP